MYERTITDQVPVMYNLTNWSEYRHAAALQCKHSSIIQSTHAIHRSRFPEPTQRVTPAGAAQSVCGDEASESVDGTCSASGALDYVLKDSKNNI